MHNMLENGQLNMKQFSDQSAHCVTHNTLINEFDNWHYINQHLTYTPLNKLWLVRGYTSQRNKKNA